MSKSRAIKRANIKAEMTGDQWLVYWDRSLGGYCLASKDWSESAEGQRKVKKVAYIAGGLA